MKVRRHVKHYKMLMESKNGKYDKYPDYEWEFYRKTQKSWKYNSKRRKQFKS